MKFSVVTKGLSKNLEFFPTPYAPVSSFCEHARIKPGSKCRDHYEALFKGALPFDILGGVVTLCPYGLATTLPTRIGEQVAVFYGLAIQELASKLPEQIPKEGISSLAEIKHFLAMLEAFSESVRKEELWHFEAALHDVRHLNHSIGQNAEQLLTGLGFPPQNEINMDSLNKNEAARRSLSVFAASRDLSMAMSLHEISRDPSQAGRSRSTVHMHRAFYRQSRISQERLIQAGLKMYLGATDKILNVSESFKLLPKVLIDNAIKYASRGGEIRVEFHERPQSFEILVKNSGPILRPDELEQVFERGFRGSNREKIEGHGLGLWLAKTIVEANSGIIKMEAQQSGVDMRGRRIGMTTVVIRLI